MDTYITLALDWLAGHPNPEAVTTTPKQWAEETAAALNRRIREIVEQLAPKIPGETYPARRARLNTARATAIELALDELLPTYEPASDEQAKTVPPLLPDLSDLI